MTSHRRSTRCVRAVARPWMLVSGRLGSRPEVSIACKAVKFRFSASLAAAFKDVLLVEGKAEQKALV